jgi:hypothetical protein
VRRNFIPGCPRKPALLAILLCWGTTAGAQGLGVERIYAHSQDAVEKAVAQIRPTAKGRIPLLEGFVGSTDQPLERYTSGFYECSIKVSPASSGGTLVRVTAKVTAWYTDSNPARSGYRSLPSNGRLETDLLDRLSEALDPGSSQGANGPPSPPEPAPSSLIRPPDAPLSAHPVSGAGAPLGLPAPAGGARLEGPGAAGAPGSAAPGSALEREQAEKHASEMRGLAQNLEEILRNQAHPDNLAAVRKSGTPVHTRPQSNAPVLFSAEAQDEFQILEVQPAWVHVQISGASRGWIRREQVELPEGFTESPGKTKEGGATPGVTFRVTHESVSVFPGKWPPLRGKTVTAISVEPTAGEASSAREKRAYAKSLLEAEYAKVAAGGDLVAGIVIVFDAADGGQIAATIEDIHRLKDGRISEAAFWQQCSLDPPEAFQDTGKPQ